MVDAAAQLDPRAVAGATARVTEARGCGPRVALAHDWLVSLRGGERVLDRLCALFGPTDLYTLVHDPTKRLTPAIDACRVHTSAMQRWPRAATDLRRWYLPWYPRAVESLRVEPRFDLLFSTSSAMVKAIRPPVSPETGRPIPHLCYCHAPARYLWSLAADYGEGGAIAGRLRALGLALAGARLRRYDRATCDRVTRFLANSSHTAREIARCYDREATVVFPPVKTDFFTPDASVSRGEHYLVVSALEPYKRVDLAVRAAARLDRPLRVAGEGTQRDVLRRMAGPNVTFLGHLGDERTRDEYRRARALLFPGVEDFGIVPVEAMACGCPVIALSRGGAEDWRGDGATLLFNEQTIQGLIEAIGEFERSGFGDAIACRRNAARFAEYRFDEAIRQAVSDTVADS